MYKKLKKTHKTTKFIDTCPIIIMKHMTIPVQQTIQKIIQ